MAVMMCEVSILDDTVAKTLIDIDIVCKAGDLYIFVYAHP